jgi:hypothetical protein
MTENMEEQMAESQNYYKIVTDGCSAKLELVREEFVPVVRCKDCKHRYFNEDMDKHCCGSWGDGYDTVVRDDDYCSYGERKNKDV